MVTQLPDRYVSHTEPEALIPNRINRERSAALCAFFQSAEWLDWLAGRKSWVAYREDHGG